MSLIASLVLISIAGVAMISIFIYGLKNGISSLEFPPAPDEIRKNHEKQLWREKWLK